VESEVNMSSKAHTFAKADETFPSENIPEIIFQNNIPKIIF